MSTQHSNTMTTTNAGFNAETLGRVLYATPFLVFGLMHFLNGGALAGVVPGWIPGGVAWVYVTGAAMLAAGVAIVANQFVRPTALALVALLAGFILTIHLPGMLAEGSSQMAMQSLLKDIGLAGGAVLLFGTRD